MRTLYLLCCLLGCYFLSAAQTKTEISYWGPKHNLSSKLVKYKSNVTLWKDKLPVESREYFGTVLDQRTLYNAYGLPVETLVYSGTDTLNARKRIVYTYNDARQKTAEMECFRDALPDTLTPAGRTQVRHYSYNGQGQLDKITYSYYNKMDKYVDVVEEYSYDENGNLFRKTLKESRSPYSVVWQYEYGTDKDNNKKVKEFFTAKRKLRLHKSYTYDTAGRLIREYERIRGGNDIVRTYEYTLDASGDWTTKKEYEQLSIYPKKYIGEYRKSRL